MPRATEESLGDIHHLVSAEIADMLQDPDPRQRREGVMLALKFLKDNNISCQLAASAPMASMAANLPTADELEKLMSMTP